MLQTVKLFGLSILTAFMLVAARPPVGPVCDWEEECLGEGSCELVNCELSAGCLFCFYACPEEQTCYYTECPIGGPPNPPACD
jgi:hypothetical protein